MQTPTMPDPTTMALFVRRLDEGGEQLELDTVAIRPLSNTHATAPAPITAAPAANLPITPCIARIGVSDLQSGQTNQCRFLWGCNTLPAVGAMLRRAVASLGRRARGYLGFKALRTRSRWRLDAPPCIRSSSSSSFTPAQTVDEKAPLTRVTPSPTPAVDDKAPLTRGMPSVSSMYPSGPGSTAPSEWPLRSFYKRHLPDSCISFSSEEGISLFTESLSTGHARSYFPLAEQFRTQDEPAFCGLTTLTMVLNSLAIDPGRIWKGGWRWFSEEMLDCCESLDAVRKRGISFDKLACLANCNGATVSVRSADDTLSVDDFRAAVRDAAGSTSHFLIVSYSRVTLGQSGDGHFSPIAAYHTTSDRVLILDTARFKYPPHWVQLGELFKAMQRPDPDSGRPRGYMCLARASGDGTPTSSVLFVLTLREGFDDGALRRIRNFLAEPASSEACPAVCTFTCEHDSRDGSDPVSNYVSCFLSKAPVELLNAVTTVVHELRVDGKTFEDLAVRPKYQDTVRELLQDIRDLPVFAHVGTAARAQPRLTKILETENGLELLTVLLLAAPVKNLSSCGARVEAAMRDSESRASDLVKNEVRALRNQMWSVFQRPQEI